MVLSLIYDSLAGNRKLREDSHIDSMALYIITSIKERKNSIEDLDHERNQVLWYQAKDRPNKNNLGKRTV